LRVHTTYASDELTLKLVPSTGTLWKGLETSVPHNPAYPTVLVFPSNVAARTSQGKFEQGAHVPISLLPYQRPTTSPL
jgi:hypothetical protein